ncbi:zinc uptake protein ZrgA [Pseudoroseicyclus aestuarii]|uniref:Uncharacterized protein DUF2796 n=1 Tax=Pseudoroseicyclus aestuarii TaxID=1795041 RepID=A0A318SRT8_9RHOB|nr:DUF2796 domain-containing protein [Pseudoroseicyclus aestuarii]PYE84403.1 uncharacterized protein DUF2796 [Pseudoroseicyclus aestuarii]
MTHRLMIAALGLAAAAGTAQAQETRELGPHEHGTGLLNIAVDGDQLLIELEAPGADITGFEHAPSTEAQETAVEEAREALSRPLELFVLTGDAGCTLDDATVEIVAGAHDHGDEEHEHEHAEDAGEHDHDHDEAEHEDHEHEEHDHDHEEAGHDDHDHDHDHDHAEGAQHNEYHASYAMTCESIDALTGIDFAYFERFENAQRLNGQMISDAGTSGFEVTRDAPSVDLADRI